ncbi:MAG: exonuclease domain-containing protein [Elusimicrobiota bacterium]
MHRIKERVFAFLDVETTGLSAFYDDRICEIGIVRTIGHDVDSEWQSLVNPERPISSGAMNVHGINDKMAAKAPKFREIADKVQSIISDAIVVCHNAPFDLSFLNSEFEKCGIAPAEFRVIDTLRIARRYFNFSSNSLGNIAYGLHIEMNEAHRALADASATQKIFAYMMSELEKRGVEDIEKLFFRNMKMNGAMIKAKQIGLPPLLEEALKNKSKIAVKYISSAGVATERILTPKEVILRQNCAYLVAHCELRSEERTFRLDRIIEIKII